LRQRPLDSRLHRGGHHRLEVVEEGVVATMIHTFIVEHGEHERVLEHPVAALGEGYMLAHRVIHLFHLCLPLHHLVETGVQPNPRTRPKYTAR
jgi:hypothetical protein